MATPSITNMNADAIRVRDARVHNLRGIDVDIPRGAFVVFTGVSGSGKSSLAFDTINAEAQRRYFDSVAPYARRLIHQATAPRVGSIDGLPPAVALEQRRSTPGARSSVGTITTIGNAVRMLMSRAGTYPSTSPERLDSDAFSPNTAHGACPDCHGLGEVHDVTEDSLVPDPNRSIRDGAVAAWPGAWQGKNQRDILAVLGHDIDAPWRELAADVRSWILFTDDQPVVTVDPVREVGRTQRPYQGQFMSARRYVMKALTMSQSARQRERALQFVVTAPCVSCGGSRIRREALAVTFAHHNIAQLTSLSLTQLADLLSPLADRARADIDAAAALCADIVERCRVVERLGLGYLSLDRPAPTLSPGELQRLRLAAQLRSGLFGVVYVLDEPSAGLHPSDLEPLIDLLDQLVEHGNSLLVVEHHLQLIERAAWLVDVGPGAGTHGGQLVYSGPLAGLSNAEQSVTRAFTVEPRTPVSPPRSACREPRGWVDVRGVSRNNLRNVDARFPTGCLTVVTGVSGSGKTTLVDALAEHLEADDARPAHRLVRIDQRPIGRTPRSNLATYTGLLDGVRKLFAATPLARERGWNAGRFSFNVAGGRCDACEGDGVVSVELMFLPGTYAPCAACGGTRYATDTLDVRWNGLSIADVLALTVDDAATVFAGELGIARSIETLARVGLGYLTLGQPATELSGGEAQRIKLASELQRTRRAGTVYVLDEPTTGLHPADVRRLMDELHALVDAGDTVVAVEHDMGVAAGADHVVDLGPGGGDDGGRIVAAGTPQEVAASADSRTAPWLARAIQQM